MTTTAGTARTATTRLFVLPESSSRGRTRMTAEPAATDSLAGGHSGGLGCRHHWVIESAAGPLSRGACKVCGEERLFRNQFQLSEIKPTRALNGRPQPAERPDEWQQRDYHQSLLPQRRSAISGAVAYGGDE